jgi:hypothetical protein
MSKHLNKKDWISLMTIVLVQKISMLSTDKHNITPSLHHNDSTHTYLSHLLYKSNICQSGVEFVMPLFGCLFQSI